MPSEQLLPCPFCGRIPKRVWQFGWEAPPGSIYCTIPLWGVDHHCPSAGHTKAEAIAAWNTRSSPSGDDVERVALALDPYVSRSFLHEAARAAIAAMPAPSDHAAERTVVWPTNVELDAFRALPTEGKP